MKKGFNVRNNIFHENEMQSIIPLQASVSYSHTLGLESEDLI